MIEHIIILFATSATALACYGIGVYSTIRITKQQTDKAIARGYIEHDDKLYRITQVDVRSL